VVFGTPPDVSEKVFAAGYNFTIVERVNAALKKHFEAD
jgi:hypothetical protein